MKFNKLTRGLAALALVASLSGGCTQQESKQETKQEGAAAAGHAAWLTDVPQALAKARAEKKMVLLDFTGSDWCPPCIAMHDKVLTSKEFEAYAEKKLVLVELDYPNKKPQPEALKAANKALAEKYKIEGYPTIILLDADGKELSKEAGYGNETPGVFIANLEKKMK